MTLSASGLGMRNGRRTPYVPMTGTGAGDPRRRPGSRRSGGARGTTERPFGPGKRMSNFGRNLALWVIIALLLVVLFNLFQPGVTRTGHRRRSPIPTSSAR